MRGTLLVLVLVGWLAIPTQAVINVTLTADDATLQPGETTRVRILAQGSDAGLAGLSGSITASGTAGLLSANADTFAWVAAFTSPEPFDSKLGTPGTNGGWSKFGSQQGSFLHPSPDFARASLTEVASYTVTAQPGSGSVTLSFVGAGVGGFVVLETDRTNVVGVFAPVSIIVSDPNVPVLGVSPAGGLDSSGTVGGPFSPAGVTYTLTNTSGGVLAWTVTKTQSWVSLSKTSGTLAAGASDTTTVSIGAGANLLAIDTYSDTVTFTNTTNGIGNTTRASI